MAPLSFKPKEAKPDQSAPESNPLWKEMNRLITRARHDRSKHESRISDCYRYTMPWRHKIGQKDDASIDLDVIFDETVGVVLEDFAADMLNTFTPQKNDWVSVEPVVSLDAGGRNVIAENLKKYQTVVFGSMARSNLYLALQEAYMDLGPGTMALMVTDIGPTKPFHCEAISISDLLIHRGPYGYIDGYFRDERKYCRSEIDRLWPNINWAAVDPTPPREDEDKEYTVLDGCWRDWSDLGDESWKYAVQVDGRIGYDKTYKGAGSCPFIGARWGTDSTTAWGCGPTYRVLPAIKTVNHFAYTTLKNYDKHVDPPTSYEDDGVMNIDNGVTPGMWIPRAPGSKEPTPIESKGRFDYEAFQIDDKRSIIRRAHYQDRPEQQGKTPPTATQWADEAAERARRMGTPATRLVHELQYPLFRRFAWLEEQRGNLPKVQIEGADIQLQPVSPLLRAQQQEAVVRRDKYAELIIARFGPQIGAIVIDIMAYAELQRADMGIEKQVNRDPQQMENAIKQLLPVLQTATAGRIGEIAPPGMGSITTGVPG